MRPNFSKSKVTFVAPCQNGFRSTQSVRKLTPFNLRHSKRQLASETGSESKQDPKQNKKGTFLGMEIDAVPGNGILRARCERLIAIRLSSLDVHH